MNYGSINMKKITTLLTAIVLFGFCFQYKTQAQNLDPDTEINLIGQTTESDSEEEPTRSYIGLGGTIGLSGDATPLGEGGFSLAGRTAFTENLSLHTSSVFQDDGLSLFALTFGVPIENKSTQREILFPFVGAGVAIEDLFGDFDTEVLVTTGVDIPLGRKFVSTVRLNASFPEDETELGLLLGVGYRFSLFDLF